MQVKTRMTGARHVAGYITRKRLSNSGVRLRKQKVNNTSRLLVLRTFSIYNQQIDIDVACGFYYLIEICASGILQNIERQNPVISPTAVLLPFFMFKSVFWVEGKFAYAHMIHQNKGLFLLYLHMGFSIVNDKLTGNSFFT